MSDCECPTNLPYLKNLTINQGDSYTDFGIVWKPDGVVANLTGYSALSYFKRDPESATPDFEATTDNGRLVITALEGKVMFNLSPADTESLSGTYAYDLKIVSGDDATVITLLKGMVIIESVVTT